MTKTYRAYEMHAGLVCANCGWQMLTNSYKHPIGLSLTYKCHNDNCSDKGVEFEIPFRVHEVKK